MKGLIPQYVVAQTILDAGTLRTAQSLNSDGRTKASGADVALACSEVTLALSSGDFPIVNLDTCFAALEAEEVRHQGQFSICNSLFDAAVETLRHALPNKHDLRMATMGLSTFFASFAPVTISIAPHLLFGDTQNRLDNNNNRYRARIRVARKGPSASCLLLEWKSSTTGGGILIAGERFLESLLQIAALAQGARKTHAAIIAKKSA